MEKGEQASFEIEHEGTPSETLVVGMSEFGLAGLTAVDFLVENLDLEETGCVKTEDLPSITPFEDGRPRHHTRFFSSDEVDLTVLLGELFIPLDAVRHFGNAIIDWTEKNNVDEILVLSGIVAPHGPEQHDVYYVATDDYRPRVEKELEPMGGGFMEGVHADLVARGIDTSLSVGVLVTPAHPPAQDVEAALRLIDAFDKVYDVKIDTAPLEEYAQEVKQHYEHLAERMENVQKESKRRVAEDRAYM
ncbi:MAG: PAC2 family protein [Halobacteriales archaeon]|nr:PAC2 family protein [Halobacteriales archaeon]